MMLIVCGDVDVERTLEVINARLKYQNISKTERLPCPKERVGSYKKSVVAKMAVERPIFSIGFKDAKAPTEPIARRRRQILTEVLTGVIFSSSNEL